MATHCPNCGHRTVLSADDAYGAGPFARCNRCGTAWRRHQGTDAGDSSTYGQAAYLPPSLRDMPEGDGIVIDHVGEGFEPPPRFNSVAQERQQEKQSRRRRTGGRYGLHSIAAFALGFAVLAGAVTLSPQIVSAFPEWGAIAGLSDAGLAFQGIESRTMRINGHNSLVVSGNITNRTNRPVPVPTVRVSLRAADGSEIYAWRVNPAADRISAGASLGFRSLLGSTPQGASVVKLSFERRPALMDAN